MIFRIRWPLTSSSWQIESLAGASIPYLLVTWPFFNPVHLQTDAGHCWPWPLTSRSCVGLTFTTFVLAIFALSCLWFCGSEENLLINLPPPPPPPPPPPRCIAAISWVPQKHRSRLSLSVSLIGQSRCHPAASGPFGRAKPISQRPLEEEDEHPCSSLALHQHPFSGASTCLRRPVGPSLTPAEMPQDSCLFVLCGGGMSRDEKLWSSCLFTSLSRRLDSKSDSSNRDRWLLEGKKIILRQKVHLYLLALCQCFSLFLVSFSYFRGEQKLFRSRPCTRRVY